MFNTNTGFGMASAMAWLYAIVVFAIIGLVAFMFKPKAVRRQNR
jgi:membrane protein implicated in regulation of membrane protease activity